MVLTHISIHKSNQREPSKQRLMRNIMTKKMTTNGVIIAQHKYARARTTMMKKTTIIKADKGMLSTILLQIEDTETIRDQRPEAPIEVAKEAADFEDANFSLQCFTLTLKRQSFAVLFTVIFNILYIIYKNINISQHISIIFSVIPLSTLKFNQSLHQHSTCLLQGCKFCRLPMQPCWPHVPFSLSIRK